MSMSNAATSINPSPHSLNVEKMCHELALRNFVRSPSLRSRRPRQTNIELWGDGGFATPSTDIECPVMPVANFCLPPNKCYTD